MRNKDKSIPQLKKIAERHFNKFIRERDKDKPCISCGKYTTLQAGHFYSGGNYSALKFEEDNVHGQCKKCNYFLSGNLTEYEKNLRRRIGNERVERLHYKAGAYKRGGFKWDRFTLIEIIETYKQKNKHGGVYSRRNGHEAQPESLSEHGQDEALRADAQVREKSR